MKEKEKMVKNKLGAKGRKNKKNKKTKKEAEENKSLDHIRYNKSSTSGAKEDSQAATSEAIAIDIDEDIGQSAALADVSMRHAVLVSSGPNTTR